VAALRLTSGVVTGPKREGFYPCGPMCCRCGARDGRAVEEFAAACGCRPCFCDECRTTADYPFDVWIASYARGCKIRQPHPHVNYAECWAAGLEPTEVREQRDGSLDVCLCGCERKWHNIAARDAEPREYFCGRCFDEKCPRFRARDGGRP
jgi:hypothetical protein